MDLTGANSSSVVGADAADMLACNVMVVYDLGDVLGLYSTNARICLIENVFLLISRCG